MLLLKRLVTPFFVSESWKLRSDYSSRMTFCSSRRARPVDGSSWMSARTGRAGGAACARVARSRRLGATTGAKRQRLFCNQIGKSIQRRVLEVSVAEFASSMRLGLMDFTKELERTGARFWTLTEGNHQRR